MNIIFFGNGNFGINTIKLLKKSNYNILSIISDVSKKSGRGLKQNTSDLLSFVKSLNIDLIQQDNIADPTFINKLNSFAPDLFIVIDYKILPQKLLDIPKLGSINLHASYLPNYKGASPIQRSLMNNDNYLGITTFFLNKHIDEGNIILQDKVKISDTTTYSEAYNVLSLKGSELMISSLKRINKKEFKGVKQSKGTKKCVYKESFTLYAKKIHKDEYIINFNITSLDLHNRIRALTMPGCYTYYKSKRIKFFDTYYLSDNINNLNLGEYKINNKKQLLVGCKVGTLIVNKVQVEGKNIIDAINFFNNNNNNNNFFNATNI